MSSLKGSSLLTRTLSGVVFAAVVVGAIVLSEWTFGALLLVIGIGCLWEFYRLADKAGFEPQRWIGIGFAGVMILTSSIGIMYARFDILFVLLVLLSFLMVVTMTAELYRNKKNPFGNIAVTTLGVLYTALPVSLIGVLGFLPEDMDAFPYTPRLVLSYIVIVWANDIGAYLVGITCGKHRLFERISPKKSWEGFFGGVAFAIGVSLLAGWLQSDSLWMWGGLGLLIAVTGVLGDLVESMLKRTVGLKDSGRIMPGHGGFLDRFDALIFSAPFVFIFVLCWHFFTR